MGPGPTSKYEEVPPTLVWTKFSFGKVTLRVRRGVGRDGDGGCEFWVDTHMKHAAGFEQLLATINHACSLFEWHRVQTFSQEKIAERGGKAKLTMSKYSQVKVGVWGDVRHQKGIPVAWSQKNNTIWF